jgi:probable HAF family extracellular repeat protein
VPPVETQASESTRLGTGPRSMASTGSIASSTPSPRGTGQRTGPGPLGPFPGFRLDRGGSTAFEAPEPGVLLIPLDVNNFGQITGEYIRPDSESGFVRDRRGRFTIFDVPGAMGTEAAKINDLGQVAGNFSENTPFVNDAAAKVHGYLRDRDRYTRIDVPGAVLTAAFGVNNRRQVVGYSIDAAGAVHAYLWSNGRFTNIDLPGATITQPIDISDHGKIVGFYVDKTGAVHGYLWDKGRIVTIDAPSVPFTIPSGIDNRGRIVGTTTTDPMLGGARGFLLASGPKGPFTRIDFPGAPRTQVGGINDQGTIVGRYENPAATPSPQPARMQPPSMMSAGVRSHP